MTSSASTSCLNCYRSYSTDNLPRTAKCSHTYCEKCLRILAQCPIDLNPIDNTLPISSYPINMAVAKSITRTHNPSPNGSFTSYSSSFQSTTTLPTASSYFSQAPSYQTKPPTATGDSFFQSTPSLPHSNPASQFPPYFSNYPPTTTPTPPVTTQPPPPTPPPRPASPPTAPKSTTTQINPQKQKEREICVLHNKQIDLICIDDGIAICSNCALFGDHKLHNIKTIESSLSECSGVAEKTLNVLSEIKKVQSQISINNVEEKIDSACQQKKLKLAGEIKAYYQKILGRVIAAEKESHLELERVLEAEKSSLKEQFLSASKEQKRSQWIEEASCLIKQADKVHHSHSKGVDKICKLLENGNKQDSFLQQGEDILGELTSFAKLSEQRINNSFSDIVITTETDQLQRLIKEGCKVSKEIEEVAGTKCISPQKGDDDLLLDSLVASQLTKRVHTFSVDTHNEFNEMLFQQFEERLHTQNLNEKEEEKQKNKSTERMRAVEKQKVEKEPFGTHNGESKKKKKIKVPEKYQQAVEDLRNDRTQIIDFTNADLGDVGLMPVFDLLRGTSRVKTLKLIRNKLTDECLPKLLECCLECKITTINLSQNSLTDYALEVLENAEYRDLRSITLNQNRINQRNARPRIQELKRIGLTVLV